MTSKKNSYLILLGILVLTLLGGFLIQPNYYNSAVDFLNKNLAFNIPNMPSKPFKLGLDLQGGTHLVYEADLSNIQKTDYSSAMSGLRDIIERRVNLFGVSEPVVQTEEQAGHNRLIIELAGIKDPAEAIKMIGQTPFLEFKEQRSADEIKKITDKQNEIKGKTQEEILKIPDFQVAYEDPFKSTDLTGKYLSKAALAFDPNTSAPEISLQFNDEGSKLFEDITGRNIGKPLAIYIDNVLLSAPVVQTKISGGKAQITGKFTVKEAQDLVKNLNAGALPVPIKMVSQESVGPTLGAASLKQSLFAGMLGFIAVVIFMIIFYRLLGVLASIALCAYVILALALFKLMGITLTLAGIGGFILSIGMAVDANILIFARMREELKSGKGMSASIEEGFRRAWPSIRDSNINSLIVCAILFTFATSFIKGFALTLSLGIVVSLFSAIFITRVLLIAILGQRLEKLKWII
ncbi:MAG: protein translocase subunit SecD [Candidatus Nealsonbacteria bacterium]|nr:protein translocase subunit SecD [Candidatus Nealsonbacteria bacterium]